MIRCFDILTGCNSVLIWIRLLPDPVKIRPDPTVMDPAGSGVMDPAGSDSNGSGRIRSNGPGRIRILKYGIRCTPTRKPCYCKEIE